MYSVVTFAISYTVYEKFDVKESDGLEISPRSSAMYISFESSHVISYK